MISHIASQLLDIFAIGAFWAMIISWGIGIGLEN